jgi:hypothetical protein
VALGLTMLVQAAVTDWLEVTLAGLAESVTAGGVETVKPPLVASSVNPLFEKRRSW